MGRKYPVILDGGSYEINPRTERDLVQCCECGLIHEIDYEVCGGKIQITTWVDGRATGQARRWMKARKEGVYGYEVS